MADGPETGIPASDEADERQGFHAALHESCFGELPPMSDEEIDQGLSQTRLLRWYAVSLDEAMARIGVLEGCLGIDPLEGAGDG